ncbi:DUF397 domain-containing protein [Streptomyces chilikensis]|uniref:DUF397 domain-containing protein n=1 Tax=Streptomyces chilikensis TaxID=1194079 RepID=UPI000AEB713C|nr:DUF397 domain-containing protein [Streptomyces chilikensis]
MNAAKSTTAGSGLVWFKSSYSGTEGGDCVEVATSPSLVHVRDSKAEAGPMVSVSHDAWAGLVALAASEGRG